MKNFKKLLIILMFGLFSLQAAKADCTISTNVYTSANPLAGCSGVVTLSGTLNLDADYSLIASGITKLIITSTGIINFTGDFDLYFPANVVMVIDPGGQIQSNLGAGPCNTVRRIHLGLVVYATCAGNGVSYTFAEVVANGGITGFLGINAGSNSPVCAGGTLNLTVTGVGGVGPYSYLWSGPGSFFSSSPTPSRTPVVPGTYNVIVTDGVGFDKDTTFTVTIGGTPPLPPVITGTTVFCGTYAAAYHASSPTALSYNWTIPPAVYNVSGLGTANITGTITNTTIGSLPFTISCTATNGCGTSTASTFVTSKKPLPPDAISGPISICGAATANYSASANGATSYLWFLPQGITISNGTGTGSINVNIAPTFVSGNISVAGVNACGSYPGPQITVYGKAPSAPSAITGPANVCGLTTATYTSSAVGATSYIWTLPPGFTGSSTSNTITVSISGYSGGNISVAGVNICGTGTPKTLVLNQTSTMPLAITGPTLTCGLTTAAYSIAPVIGATGYTWTAPTGATIVGNGTSATATFATPSTGNISVTATNGCTTSTARTLAINKLEPAPGVITGPISGLCARDTATYSIVPIAGATGYNWFVPAGMVILNGQGTNSIFVNSIGTSNGSIKVAAKNACGTGTSSSLAINCLNPLGMISEEVNDNLFSLYPNPVSDEFTVQINNLQLTGNNQQIKIEMYDVLGKIVLQSLIQNQTSTINISHLNKGIYFVKLIEGNNNLLYTQKIIKE